MKDLKIISLSWRIIIIIFMLILCLPQLISLTKGVPPLSDNLTVNKEQKLFVSLMKTVLKSGDVCVDDAAEYANAAPIGSLAGCYGTGYRLLRENVINKKTVFATMDPNLLHELNINYIIITEPQKLNSKVISILKNTQLFTQLFKDSNLPWLVFRFNREVSFNYPKSYTWAIAIEGKNGYQLHNERGQILFSENRALLQNTAAQLREKAALDKDISKAIWLDVMPFPQDIINNIKNQNK
jgi:hypothetical protein